MLPLTFDLETSSNDLAYLLQYLAQKRLILPPQIREEFCSRCRRIRNQITAVLFYVFFPLTFPLATFLFFYRDHFVKTPPATPLIHMEMSEEEYRRERTKRHALLEEMDREIRQRNLRRLRWMTLGLVPKRILACLA